MKKLIATFLVSFVALAAGCLVPPPNPLDNDPNVSPLTVGEFRVLVQYDAKATYPEKTNQVLVGQQVRQYLKEHCILGEDGKTHDYRFLDKNTPLDGVWLALTQQKNAKKPNPSNPDDYPWVYCSNGSTGLSERVDRDGGGDGFINLIKPVAEPK